MHILIKKIISCNGSQCLTIDTLEARVDELQKKCDELNKRYEALVRDQQTRIEVSDVKAIGVGPTAQVSLVRTAPKRDGSTQNVRAMKIKWRNR